jgi:plasmid stability protein
MATLTIRQLDDGTKGRLRVQAARNNRSMEEEAREILRRSLDQDTSEDLFASIRRHIEPLGGVELKIPKRRLGRKPPDFK